MMHNVCLYSLLLLSCTLHCMETVTFIEQKKEEHYKQKYKQEFHNYFFAADTANRFFSFWSDEAKKNPKLIVSKDSLYRSCMSSSPNSIDSYRNCFNITATCIIQPLSPEWCYFAGFNDGSILIEGINGYKHVFNSMHNVPISALAQGRGTFSNTKHEPFIFIGYQDGTIAFANKKHGKALYLGKKKAITCIAQGPVDNSWMIAENNTISLFKESHNYPLLSQDKNTTFMKTSLPLKKSESFSIKGLGLYHNTITVHMNDDRTLLWLPYSKTEFDILYDLDFPCKHIKAIHKIIKRHTKKEHYSQEKFTPIESTICFRELPDLVKQIISIKTVSLLKMEFK